MRSKDTHAADDKTCRRRRMGRLLSVGLLAGAAVALAAGSWWGMQLKEELAFRDALISRLVAENLNLEQVRDRARDLEMIVAELDSAPAALRSASVGAEAAPDPARLPEMLATAEQRRFQAKAVIDRLMAERAADPIEATLTVATEPTSATARLAAALDRTLAERASAEIRVRSLYGKAASLEAERDRLQQELEATRQRFQTWVQEHYGALRGVLKTSGVRVDPLVKLATAKMEGEGGPFVPLPSWGEGAGRTTLVPLPPELDADFRAAEVMRALLVALPLGLPTPDAQASSGFGIRRDPFTGKSAMHTGLDFIPGSSDKAYATAPGTVVIAGREGAYGKMVEIDHGLGLATRYAHLAAIDVQPGERVARGAEIGTIGSTGRSTGRHLHYEIRVDGQAVDPADFLEARARLANVLSQK